ncbi:VanZ family protein [Dysgonomonas sp. 25]|uniref:VanZ family protein n=1 Tax=Dysgonomonas sp. 25 TaxID=2302933 RepID=UPI0013D5CC84|nr:VanZ family protein [Dysgonomonas sp. 25]NDV68496.1 hypothetical protein [Dysgonomonas sp. 25]
MAKFLKYTTLPLIVAIVIFYLCCLITGDDVPEIDDFFIPFDKFAHFMMYLGLAGSACFSYIFFAKGRVIILRMLFFCILLPILYGGLIELVQHYYFAGRSGDWYDFLADALGAFTAIPFALFFRKLILRKQLKEQI